MERRWSKGWAVELSKIIEELSAFKLKEHAVADKDFDIQTHKMIKPKQEKYFPPCLYVGYASELPERLGGDEVSNLIVIDDAPVSEELLACPVVSLYSVPFGTNQFDVLNAIADILVDEAAIVQSMRRILEVLYQGAGIQALVEVASDVFSNPIFLNDASYKIIAMSHGVHFSNETLEKEKSLGMVAEENMDAMRRDEVIGNKILTRGGILTQKRADRDETWLFANVKLHGVVVGTVAIVDEIRSFVARDYELLERFVKVVAIELEKDVFYRESRGVMFNYLLSDLLLGKVLSHFVLDQRFSIIGWRPSAYTMVVTVTDPSMFIRAEKVGLIAENLTGMIDGARWTFFKQGVVLFVSRGEPEVIRRDELESLKAFLESNELVAGVSMAFSDLLQAPRHYRQSVRAIDAGIMVQGEERLFGYSDMIVLHASRVLLKRDSAEEYRPSSVAALQAYDGVHGTRLEETLEVFLDCGGSQIEAATRLFIHRNTLQYRLKKIAECSGVDYSDGKDRLAAQLYFTLKRVQEKAR